MESLLQTRLYDPFALLGIHHEAAEWAVRVYEPDASQVDLLEGSLTAKLIRIHPSGVFEWRGKNEPARPVY